MRYKYYISGKKFFVDINKLSKGSRSKNTEINQLIIYNIIKIYTKKEYYLS